MVMAASVPLSRSTPRSLSSFSSRFTAPSPRGGPRFVSFAWYPSWRVSASMSIEAPEKAPNDSFLDRKESGFLHFVKYQGLGNDFILVDGKDSSETRVTPEQAIKLCDRNFGVGADGVIFAMPGINGTDYTMRIVNSDGSEPKMCSNGVHCFARFIAELEILTGKQRLGWIWVSQCFQQQIYLLSYWETRMEKSLELSY